jgi:lysophospholipase L1-like esterase
VVDLYQNWAELADHPEYIASDGFHPSAEGYARLSELFWTALCADESAKSLACG